MKRSVAARLVWENMLKDSEKGEKNVTCVGWKTKKKKTEELIRGPDGEMVISVVAERELE